MCGPRTSAEHHGEELTALTDDHLLFDGPRTTYGRVRVLHQIGAGSVGPVFRGEDPATRRAVVVKVLRMGLSPERVAIVAAALAAARERLPRHPALCEMVDSGVQDAEPFVVSAFVEGDSLDVALREYGPANIVDALPRLRLLADALDSAAAVGVTHGGLHLRDILVSPEHTVLTGIGVAPILERVGVRAPVRRPYAAPEVVEGLGVGPAADQFALVAIAHEWLSGRRVSGPGAEGFHIRATTPAGTEAVAAVFCRGLDEQPEARYPTATSWVEALAEVGDALAPRTRLSKRRAPAAEAPRLAFDLGDDDNASEGASGGALGASGDDDGVVLGPPGRDDEATDHAGGITLALDAGDDAGRSGAMDESRPDDDEPRLHIDLALGSAPVASADAGQAEHDEAPEAEAPDVADHPMADVLAAADPDADVHRGGAVRLDADPDDVLSGAMEHPAVPVVTGSLRPPVVAVAEDEAPEERATALPASPAAWAVALVVLAGVAVGVGALLARWGTPSAPAPDTTSMEASAPVADVTTPAAPAATAAAPRAAAAATSPAVVAAAPAAASPAGAADSSRTAASDTALQPAAESARGATARPRPAASARSAAASLPGRLLVRSSPTGAEVFVNGQRRGVTPLAVRDLALGAYAVRLSRPGFDAADQRVTLDAGRPSRAIEVTLRRTGAPPAAAAPAGPGTLVVDSRPAGATVAVDGRPVGRTPLTLPGVAPGAHTIRIQLEGYLPITTTTRVEPGARARVAVSLTTERPRTP